MRRLEEDRKEDRIIGKTHYENVSSCRIRSVVSDVWVPTIQIWLLAPLPCSQIGRELFRTRCR